MRIEKYADVEGEFLTIDGERIFCLRIPIGIVFYTITSYGFVECSDEASQLYLEAYQEQIVKETLQ